MDSRRLLRGLVAIGFITLSLTGSTHAKDQIRGHHYDNPPPGLAHAPDEIIVQFKPGAASATVHSVNTKHGTSVLSTSRFAGFKRLRIPATKTVEEMVEIYSRNPNVEFAEPNHVASALTTPSDPFYVYQWNFDNGVYGGIHMESAWDLNPGGSSDVIVAVLDTGVAYEDYGAFRQAPDLAQTLFVPGYDFVDNDAHPNDENSHGTHVTGTIAQSTNNGSGVAGIAYNTAIMPVRVLDENGSGYYSDIADGIYFATNNGAKIINLSLGGTYNSPTLRNALAHAYGNGVTVVAAAGNSGPAGPPLYPAANDAYVIAVGSTRYDENISYFSTWGSYVDVSAPGGDVTVDQNGDGYGDGILQQTINPSTKNPADFGYYFFQGTSMATPHVAGVAALLIANGTSHPDDVREALEATVEDHGAVGWDPAYGWGIISTAAALSYGPAQTHDVAVTDVTAPSSALLDTVVPIDVTVENLGNFPESFIVTLKDTTDQPILIDQIGVLSLPAGATANLNFSWDTQGQPLGDHSLTVEADTVDGEINSDNNTQTVIVSIQDPVHDIALSAMDLPSNVGRGQIVPVSVTVFNKGTFSETTTVQLNDSTDGVFIGAQAVTVEPSTEQDLVFNWDTSASTIGDHDIVAEASPVPDESSLNDNSRSALVSVGVPDINIQPSTFDFGTVTIWRTQDKDFLVSNFGAASLHVSGLGMAGPDNGQFSVIGGAGPFSLEPGASTVLTVRFAPTSTGSKNASLEFFSDDPDENPATILLSGIGGESIDADLDGKPDDVDECTVLAPASQGVTGGKLILKNLHRAAGRQHIFLRGAFKPATTSPPIDPLLNGMHVRVEDQGGLIYEVNIPGGAFADPAAGHCGPRDGWRTKGGTVWKYVNKSGAVPPACTPGSAGGIRMIAMKDMSRGAGSSFKFTLKAVNTSFSRLPQNPIRRMQFDLAMAAQPTPGSASPQALAGQCAEFLITGNPVRSTRPAPFCKLARGAKHLKCIGP